MRNVHAMVIRSTFLGSILIVALCLAVTSGAAPAAAGTPAPQEATLVELESATAQRSEPGECRVSRRYPENILQWCGWITEYAGQQGLEPDLIAAVMLQESGGDALAYSHSGAVGLLQVMPRDGIAARFQCVNGPCFASRPTIAELQDPEYNIEYGVRMLAGLVGRLGSVREALKAYGPMDVGYYYADKVLAIYENYQE